jgi:phosphate-selective porin
MLILVVGVLAVQSQEGGTIKVAEGDLTIGGYIHLWGTSVDDDTTQADTPDAFAPRRTRLILTGHVVPKVAYRLQEELVLGNATSRDALIKFEDIALGEQFMLNITAGQYKYPLSEAGLKWGTPADELIRGPWIYEGGNGAGSTIGDRDIGILADSAFMDKKIKAYLGFFNGNGTNAAEINDQKDLMLRITAAPFEKGSPVEGLSFGLGYMKGAQGAESALPNITGMELRTRLVATVKYDKELGGGTLSAIGEYLSQVQEQNTANSKLNWDDAETTNSYLQLSYKTKVGFLSGEDQFLQPVLRYQTYDTDDGDLTKNETADWEGTMITAGCNLIFNKYTRLMLNYNSIDDDTWVTTEGKRIDLDNNEVLLQLELKF